VTVQVFVAPPEWPQPPEGWVPPAGWVPDPSWPPAPPGWQFWHTVPVIAPAAAAAPAPTPGELFGGRRHDLEAELEALQELVAATRDENTALSQANAAFRAETQRLTAAVDALNAELRRLLGIDPALVRAETARMIQERDSAQAQVRAVAAELATAQRQLVAVRDMTIMQEAHTTPRRTTASAPCDRTGCTR